MSTSTASTVSPVAGVDSLSLPLRVSAIDRRLGPSTPGARPPSTSAGGWSPANAAVSVVRLASAGRVLWSKRRWSGELVRADRDVESGSGREGEVGGEEGRRPEVLLRCGLARRAAAEEWPAAADDPSWPFIASRSDEGRSSRLPVTRGRAADRVRCWVGSLRSMANSLEGPCDDGWSRLLAASSALVDVLQPARRHRPTTRLDVAAPVPDLPHSISHPAAAFRMARPSLQPRRQCTMDDLRGCVSPTICAPDVSEG